MVKTAGYSILVLFILLNVMAVFHALVHALLPRCASGRSEESNGGAEGEHALFFGISFPNPKSPEAQKKILKLLILL